MTKEVKLSPLVFSKPFARGTAKTFAAVDGLVGVFNPEVMSWSVEPRYANCIPLAASIVAVVTPSNSIGVSTMDGHMVLDTLYDDIYPLFSERPNRQPSFGEGKMWFGLNRGGVEVIMNEHGRVFTNHEMVDSVKMASAFYQLQSDDQLGIRWGKGYSRNGCTECLHIGADSAQWNQLQMSNMRKAIFHEAENVYSQYRPCFSNGQNIVPCLNRKAECKSRSSLRAFQLDYISKAGFSLRNWYTINTDRLGMPVMPYYQLVNAWSNFVEMDGRLQKIHIADIFGTGNLLYKEFVEAVKQRDDLDLKCGTVSEVELVVGEKFSFSKDGVLLHIHQSGNSRGATAEILIPWTNLLKHEKSKEIASLFL